MDPALHELLAAGEKQDTVAAILRLDRAQSVPKEVEVISRFGQVATVRLRRQTIPEVWAESAVASLKAPRGGLSPEPAEETIISSQGQALEDDVELLEDRRRGTVSETGKGVVLGVIDWGFDFAHPEFVNSARTTRILALWDQRSQPNALSPAPYGYGVVHRADAINQALQTDNPYKALGYRPTVGAHGTHVASIAGGNGLAGGPEGLAPEVSFVFVHLSNADGRRSANLGDSASLLEAVDFIGQVAGDRPCVINTSLGRHGEQHDGSTLVEQGLDAFVSQQPGRAIVQSCGNYFSQRIHTSGQLRPGEQRQFVWQVEPADRTPNELEVWYSGRDRFSISLSSPKKANAADEIHKETEKESTLEATAALGEQISLQQNGDHIGTLYHRRHEPNTGDNHIDIFLYPTAAAGDWIVTLVGEDVIDGNFHTWIERDSSIPHSQSRLDSADVVTTTTTGTICNGFRTIAVGAYNPHSASREIASFSSSGPTRDGRIKPDLVAPGVGILAARAAAHLQDAAAPLLMRKSGTSMAAPHVSGTIALMFEAAGQKLPIEETRRLLLMSAQPTEAWPVARIGSGYLDAERVIAATRSAYNQPSQSPTENIMSQREDTLIREFIESDLEAFHGANFDADTELSQNVIEADVDFIERDSAERDLVEREDSDIESAELYAAVVTEGEHSQESCCGEDDAIEVEGLTLRENVRQDDDGYGESSPSERAYEEEVHEEDVLEAAGDRLPTLVEIADWTISTASSGLSQENWLAQLVQRIGETESVSEQETEDIPEVALPLSPGYLFDAFSPFGPLALRQYYEQFFELVAGPKEQIDQPLKEGQILLRRSHGEGRLGHAAMLVSGEMVPQKDLPVRRLCAESARTGLYAQVIEAGPLPCFDGDRFARRVADEQGYLPANQMLLEIKEPASSIAPIYGVGYTEDDNSVWLETSTQTTFRLRNRILAREAVRDSEIRLLGTGAVAGRSASVRVNRIGTARLDLSSLPDGDYRLQVLPDEQTTAAVGPAIATTAPRPSRIWRPLESTITISSGQIAATTSPHVSISGRTITVGIQPVWMASPNRGARPTGTTITHIVVHHTGGTRASSALNTFMNTSAVVSAHYLIDTDGQVIKLVSETERSNHAGNSHWAGQDSVNAFSVGIEVVHRSGAYTAAQYTALIDLLKAIRTAYPTIGSQQIVGHSDIATSGGAPRRLGRKLSDPGATFDWERLEAAGLGIPVPSALRLASLPRLRRLGLAGQIYGGFFNVVTGGSLRVGDRDSTQRFGGRRRTAITTAVVAELQTDLASIGYFSPVTGRFERPTEGAVKVFQEHFLSRARADGRVDEETAEAIKFVRP